MMGMLWTPDASACEQRPDETPSLTPVTHRGISLHVTDCGTWMWACDDHEAADMAATLGEARRQIDALLGPEVAP